MDSDYFSIPAHEQLHCAFTKAIVLLVKLYRTEKTDDSGRRDLRFNIGVREAIGIHGSEMGTADDAHH